MNHSINERRDRQNRLIPRIGLVLVIFLVLWAAACAPGPNQMTGTEDPEGKVAGFFPGLWHGFIALFTFIISIFSDKVNLYEVHNSGLGYNLGFILGVMIFFGGSGGAKKKSQRRKKRCFEEREEEPGEEPRA